MLHVKFQERHVVIFFMWIRLHVMFWRNNQRGVRVLYHPVQRLFNSSLLSEWALSGCLSRDPVMIDAISLGFPHGRQCCSI